MHINNIYTNSRSTAIRQAACFSIQYIYTSYIYIYMYYLVPIAYVLFHVGVSLSHSGTSSGDDLADG